jgi:hypothetical protein
MKLTSITTAPSIDYKFHGQMKYIFIYKPFKVGKQVTEMGKFLHDGLKVTPAPG